MIGNARISVLALALCWAVACAGSQNTTPNDSARTAGGTQLAANAPAERCRIENQTDAVNEIIEGSANNPANIAAHANELAEIARVAGAGAANRSDGIHEVSCRRIALQAYQALLRVPGREDAALQGIRDQSTDGALTCAALGDAADIASRRDCDLIQTWRRTVDMAQALQNIRALRSGFEPTTPTNTVVPDEVWTRIGDEVASVRNNVANGWPQVSGQAEHKTRLACDFYGQMVSLSQYRGPPNSEIHLHRYYEAYPQVMSEAASALGAGSGDPACTDAHSAACSQARVRALQAVCISLSGS
jgi:hypothetical protein